MESAQVFPALNFVKNFASQKANGALKAGKSYGDNPLNFGDKIKV
jgi:hypothetical protein